MKKNNELPEDEKFSDDPEENLRMQNDFLKLKMMAESGAFFGGDGNLPPDIENQFLKNVMEFEKVNSNSKPQKIFDLLGQPYFEDEKNLKGEEFKTEFKKLEKLLKKHHIQVNFIAKKPGRFKYNFIITELFEHETDMVLVKGMTANFVYEEFHPDHKQEISDLTNLFLNDFFDRKLNIDTYYLDDEQIQPDSKIVSKQDLINRFDTLYEVAEQFENNSFNIEKIDFELNEFDETHSGMGFSEGEINYEMVFKQGERKVIQGPFKIYFARKWDCWIICFFYLAGFNLHAKVPKASN